MVKLPKKVTTEVDGNLLEPESGHDEIPRDKSVLKINQWPQVARRYSKFQVTFALSPLPQRITKLHLQKHAISVPQSLSKSYEKSADTLELYTTVVRTSTIQEPEYRNQALAFAATAPQNVTPYDGEVTICQACVQQETAKNEKKKGRTKSWQKDVSKSVILFHSLEEMEWLRLDAGDGLCSLFMRIACTCLHQKEREGFQVIFTIKDWNDRLIAQEITFPIVVSHDLAPTVIPRNTWDWNIKPGLVEEEGGEDVFKQNLLLFSPHTMDDKLCQQLVTDQVGRYRRLKMKQPIPDPSITQSLPSIEKPPENNFEGTFKCKICFKLVFFKTLSTWISHVYCDLEPYTCFEKDCQLGPWKSKPLWTDHDLKKHRDCRKFWCREEGCSYKTYQLSAFKNHGIKKHGSQGESCCTNTSVDVTNECCRWCGADGFTHINDLYAHWQKHVELFSLTVLPYIMQGQKDTRLYERISEADQMESSIQSLPLITIGETEKHRRLYGDPSSFKTMDCEDDEEAMNFYGDPLGKEELSLLVAADTDPQIYPQILDNNWEESVEILGENGNVCYVCKKSYSDQNRLKRHLKTHNEIRLTCPHCPRTYARKDTMDDHIKTHSKPTVCEICQKSFPTSHSLRTHIGQHSKSSLPCPMTGCGKVCDTPRKLTSHIRRHNKPHVCHICEYGFTHEYQLRNHLNGLGESFTCDTCSKPFHYFNKMSDHMLEAHNKIQARFTCPREECGKGYDSKDRLEQHERKHEKNPFWCSCIALFPTQQKLIGHRKRNKRHRSQALDVVEEYEDTVGMAISKAQADKAGDSETQACLTSKIRATSQHQQTHEESNNFQHRHDYFLRKKKNPRVEEGWKPSDEDLSKIVVDSEPSQYEESEYSDFRMDNAEDDSESEDTSQPWWEGDFPEDRYANGQPGSTNDEVKVGGGERQIGLDDDLLGPQLMTTEKIEPMSRPQEASTNIKTQDPILGKRDTEIQKATEALRDARIENTLASFSEDDEGFYTNDDLPSHPEETQIIEDLGSQSPFNFLSSMDKDAAVSEQSLLTKGKHRREDEVDYLSKRQCMSSIVTAPDETQTIPQEISSSNPISLGANDEMLFRQVEGLMKSIMEGIAESQRAFSTRVGLIKTSLEEVRAKIEI